MTWLVHVKGWAFNPGKKWSPDKLKFYAHGASEMPLNSTANDCMQKCASWNLWLDTVDIADADQIDSVAFDRYNKENKQELGIYPTPKHSQKWSAPQKDNKAILH